MVTMGLRIIAIGGEGKTNVADGSSMGGNEVERVALPPIQSCPSVCVDRFARPRNAHQREKGEW